MASLLVVLCMLLPLIFSSFVEGKTYIVGDKQGWSAIDYSAWLKDKVFTVGDELVFPYSQGAQDVAEVSQVDYETCNGKSPLNQWINGDTHVMLTTPGNKYYICSFPGHCPPLKLAINVLMSANSTTNSTTIPMNQVGTNVNTIAAQHNTPPSPSSSNYGNNNKNNSSSFNGASLLHLPYLTSFFSLFISAFFV
eukprot:c20160_g1_i1 orf=276-857(-)